MTTAMRLGLVILLIRAMVADESILTDAPVQDSEFLDLEASAVDGADSSLNAVF